MFAPGCHRVLLFDESGEVHSVFSQADLVRVLWQYVVDNVQANKVSLTDRHALAFGFSRSFVSLACGAGNDCPVEG